MKWLQKVTGGYSSSAKVVDGTLILSLPDAVSPVVWRWDLGSVKSSALEVREKEGQFILMLKTPKGDVSEVAPFTERGRALRALMAVSDAMESAHGEIRPLAANDEAGEAAPAARRPKGKSNFAAGLVGVIVLVALVALLIHLSPAGNMMGEDLGAAAAGGGGTTVAGQTAAGPDATGVPLSADDYLLKRQ
jgi:hypothetical protein